MTPWNYDLEAGKTGELVWLGIKELRYGIFARWSHVYLRWENLDRHPITGTVLAFARIEPAPAWGPGVPEAEWLRCARAHAPKHDRTETSLLAWLDAGRPDEKTFRLGFNAGAQFGEDVARLRATPPIERANPAPASDVAGAIEIVEAKRKGWLNVERQANAYCHDFARGNACGKRQAADEIIAALRTASEGDRT